MTFGPRSREPRGTIDLTLTPGDAVEIRGGRGHGTLEAFEDVSTPSGATVRIARVKRPRSRVYVFPDMLVRLIGQEDKG